MPAGADGFSIGKKEDKLGIRASSTGNLIFDECRIPAHNLLGKQGDGNMQRGRPQTWGGEANDALFTDAGVITTGGAIHSRVAWFCRGQPRVKQACAPSSLPPAPSLR